MVSITRLSNDTTKNHRRPQVANQTAPRASSGATSCVIELDRRLGLATHVRGWLWRRTASLYPADMADPGSWLPRAKGPWCRRSPVGPLDRSDARACARDACANTINAGATWSGDCLGDSELGPGPGPASTTSSLDANSIMQLGMPDAALPEGGLELRALVEAVYRQRHGGHQLVARHVSAGLWKIATTVPDVPAPAGKRARRQRTLLLARPLCRRCTKRATALAAVSTRHGQLRRQPASLARDIAQR